jgi:hypothetical protein
MGLATQLAYASSKGGVEQMTKVMGDQSRFTITVTKSPM